jgi:hypothetical protein
MTSRVRDWINSTRYDKWTSSSTIDPIFDLRIPESFESLHPCGMKWHVLVTERHLHWTKATLALRRPFSPVTFYYIPFP